MKNQCSSSAAAIAAAPAAAAAAAAAAAVAAAASAVAAQGGLFEKEWAAAVGAIRYTCAVDKYQQQQQLQLLHK
ncbi:hypothetical protein Emed_007160 [Eimeria media]